MKLTKRQKLIAECDKLPMSVECEDADEDVILVLAAW